MGKHRILVVEDEKDIRMFLKEALIDEGYEVKTADNGLQAQKIMEDETFHIVILDMLLPGEHGLNIVNHIKDKYFTPIIITSGIYNRTEILKDLEDSNVRDFFPKPFNIEMLLERIRQILDEN